MTDAAHAPTIARVPVDGSPVYSHHRAVDRADAVCMRLITPLVLIGLLTTSAQALTEDEKQWQAEVTRFASGLGGHGDDQAIRASLSTEATLRAFDHDRIEPAWLISDRMAARQLVSARAYMHPGVSIASDLLADVQAFGQMDPALADQLALPDTGTARSADATMARWFSIALGAQAGDPVALLAFYDDGTADVDAGRTASRPRLLLVLARGEYASDGSFKIARLAMGDTEQATE